MTATGQGDRALRSSLTARVQKAAEAGVDAVTEHEQFSVESDVEQATVEGVHLDVGPPELSLDPVAEPGLRDTLLPEVGPREPPHCAVERGRTGQTYTTTKSASRSRACRGLVHARQHGRVRTFRS